MSKPEQVTVFIDKKGALHTSREAMAESNLQAAIRAMPAAKFSVIGEILGEKLPNPASPGDAIFFTVATMLFRDGLFYHITREPDATEDAIRQYLADMADDDAVTSSAAKGEKAP